MAGPLMGRMLVDSDPIDDLHRQCLEARNAVRRATNAARRRLHLPERTYE